MGTQSSNNGPGDIQPLLPDWALSPVGDVVPASDPEEAETDAESEDADDYGDEDVPSTSADNDETLSTVGPQKPLTLWRVARSRLGRLTSGANDEKLRGASSAYVRARGGRSGAAQKSAAGRTSTVRLGSFLSGVAREGIRSTLTALGLQGYIGQDVDIVLSAIADALTPAGALPDEVVARRAVNEVLEGLCEAFALGDTIQNLDRLTADDVRRAIVESVALFIYYRWLQELGKKIEQKAISPEQAVRLERDVKAFVLDSVQLDLKDQDVLAIQWDGSQGQAFIMQVYSDAYGLLGE
jgi:hypothetical protein